MKRVLLIVAFLVALAAGWWGYETYLAPNANQDSTALDESAEILDELENVIWASGKLIPVRWAGLEPVSQGLVSKIHVAEGDWVTGGDVLVEMDNGVLQSQVASAEATLAEANAALNKLLAGATDAEIAAAEAQVAAAQAGIALAAGQMLEAQAAIDSAEAQVEIARRQYNELASHPTAAELEVAKAEIAVAQAAVTQAQAAYNLVRSDLNIAARPESMVLNQATASLEAAQSRAGLTSQGPTPQQLAVAQSAIDAAEVAVAAARSRAPGVEANVQSAMANQASAQAALEKLLAGATAEDIAMAEAGVQSAQAALESVRAQLRLGQVIAPFDGQVGEISVRPGELTAVGQAVLLLGDTREMYVETTDLRETDVVNVRLEMPVEVTFDALPDRIFRGDVTRIAPVSNIEKGSTNYTVHVVVDELDDSLRWGMTAFVNIRIDR